MKAIIDNIATDEQLEVHPDTMISGLNIKLMPHQLVSPSAFDLTGSPE